MSRKAAPQEYKRRSKGKGFAAGPRLEFRGGIPRSATRKRYGLVKNGNKECLISITVFEILNIRNGRCYK